MSHLLLYFAKANVEYTTRLLRIYLAKANQSCLSFADLFWWLIHIVSVLLSSADIFEWRFPPCSYSTIVLLGKGLSKGCRYNKTVSLFVICRSNHRP